MSTPFVSESGLVIWRVAERTSRELRAAGRFVDVVGSLCCACLAGSWRRTLLRQRQVVCDDCRALLADLARRADLADPLAPSDDDARSRSVAHRERRLRGIFDDAVAQGVTFADVVEPSDDSRELPRVVYDALVSQDAESRVRRFADWVLVLGPDGRTLRESALADVVDLADAYRERQRTVRIARARSQLNDSLGESMRLTKRIAAQVGELMAAEQGS